nr:glycosyltransferase family 2 protein [uncultured Romboutsia sp.]
MQEKVSIILPLYNSEKTIEATIESIINQTYKNIELIIINDGSNDKSYRICELYSKKYSNIIKYIYKVNEGVSKSRNLGIEKSTGKFICFIDSDDEYNNNFIEILVQKIEDTDSEMVACGYHSISGEIKEFGFDKDILFENKELNYYIEKLQSIECFNQVWNKIYRKEIIIKNKINFEENLDLGEDFIFNISYLNYVNKVAFISDKLYKYKISADGLNFKYKKNLIDIKLNLNAHLEKFYTDKGYDMEYVYYDYIKSVLSSLSSVNDYRNEENLIEKKIKYDEILNYRTKIKLNFIKNKTKNIKLKIIITILMIKNIYLVDLLSKTLFIYNYNRKKKTFGI